MGKSRISLIVNLPADQSQCQLVELCIQNLITAAYPEQIQIMNFSSRKDIFLASEECGAHILFFAYQHFCYYDTHLPLIVHASLQLQRELKERPASFPPTFDYLEQLFSSYIRSTGATDYTNPYITEHALQIISQRYTSLSLEDLAVLLTISRSYLCRIISKDTGCSFLELLHYRRILSAAEEFITCPANLSIENLAFKLGYTSLHHFYRVFKQYTGLTPASARKLLKKYIN